MRLISQLIKDISRVIQKILKYFSSTAISTFFVLPSAGIFPVIHILDLNNSEFSIRSAVSFLQYCHKLPDVFE